ncbi:hypothetical protein SARC_01254 [Sphaeroforma arctica JP610]|uniref:BED-type domain-containing protein n=1 Tax=Sphaeroforma arctica JP610 TaxID=667725 RepID=A0A0L0GCA8_9EUKA|nr:hypothetical protein SARC_01254 [Sphaeroforma arctica JP610]KNC86625.1 hypothetical protein SARC_01254 [Sphaeroforma arctica JP610]|eukprot:XP_014160527.1 hypothetical protein SARC_01254 [Sphaeroforma arctica JP610]
MGRKADPVRKAHYVTRLEKGKEINQCNYCDKDFSQSNVRQLKEHLANTTTSVASANVREKYAK